MPVQQESYKITVEYRRAGNLGQQVDLFNTEIIPEMRSDLTGALSPFVGGLVLEDYLDLVALPGPPPNVWLAYPKIIAEGDFPVDRTALDQAWSDLLDTWKEKMREKLLDQSATLRRWHRHKPNQGCIDEPG